MGIRNVPFRAVLLLWIAISVVLVWACADRIVTLSGWDPDDQLRLVQLRDWLGGQSWFDTTQYRMNGAEGAPMHWTRLVELPLALFVLLLSPLIGQPAAEMVAGTLVPLLLLGAIGWVLAQIAARISNGEAGVVAALLAFISPALLLQLRPMRIDHHGWQILMAVIALWSMLWPDKRRGGIVLGVALAIWLHISLEGAPMTAAFFLFLGWRWVIEKAHGKRLFWTIASFAASCTILFIATTGNVLRAGIYCDSISLPHMAAIAVATAIMLPVLAQRPDHRRFRLLAALAAAAAAAIALVLIAPQCMTGAFAELDPLVHDYWYIHVSEGLPVWRQPWVDALSMLAGPICGLFALYVLQSGVPATSKDLRLVGFFLLYATLLSLFVFRTISVAAAFAVPVVAVWIGALFQRYRKASDSLGRVGLVALMLALLIPGALVAQVARAGTALVVGPPDPAETAKREQVTLCESVLSVRELRAIANARFLAPFDMGPTILLTTQNQVLASSHHRNRQGMHDHIEIFRSQPDIAHALLLKRGITHIAVCPGEAELEFYAKKDPAGLWAVLKKGPAPSWLQPLPDMGEGIKVWRVN